MNFALVYQCGLANVFEITRPMPNEIGYRRVKQDAFCVCEWFCEGAIAAGAHVTVHHCDECGDIAKRPWSKGVGELWADKKNPPTKS